MEVTQHLVQSHHRVVELEEPVAQVLLQTEAPGEMVAVEVFQLTRLLVLEGQIP
jgi:hypothetical protein